MKIDIGLILSKINGNIKRGIGTTIVGGLVILLSVITAFAPVWAPIFTNVTFDETTLQYISKFWWVALIIGLVLVFGTDAWQFPSVTVNTEESQDVK